LHERFASPLYSFAFVLMVMAFMGQAQTTRSSRTQGLILAFAICAFYRIAGITAANYVVVRPATASLVYAPPAIAAITAAIMVQWRLYPRRRSRLTRAVAAIGAGVGDAFAALWSRRPPAHARTAG
jgi:lipopolysaccharide export system permease protein